MDVDVALVQNMQQVDVIEIISSDDDAIDAAVAARRHADVAAAARRRADAAAARQRAVKITHRGPKIKGHDTYDPYCVFPNKVALKNTQVKFLKQFEKEKPTIPLYVCTMQSANIEDGKAKMYFTRKYSNAYINKHLDLPANVKVYSGKKRCAKVRIMMGKGKGKGAQITSNWNEVVDKTVKQKGDIFMFRFRRSSEDGLKLIVEEVM